MHDLDRTQLEAEEAYIDEFEEEYEDEFENEDDDEFDDEFEDEYDDEFEEEDNDEEEDDDEFEDEFEEEYEDEFEYALDPDMELEFTEDLLEVNDDEELEQFLGAIISAVAPMALKALPHIARGATKLLGGWLGRAGRRPTRHRRYPSRRRRYPSRRRRYRRYEMEMESEQFLGSLIRKAIPLARRFLGSRTGRMLTSHLRKKARQIIPGLGGRLGGYIGGRLGHRRAGQRIGRWAASQAVRRLGLEYELEGLPPEEREFEAARQFVKFAADATKRAMLAPKGASSKAVVAKAIKKAAKKHAPGLVKKSASSKEYFISPSLTGKKRSGKWMRKGSKIVITGV